MNADQYQALAMRTGPDSTMTEMLVIGVLGLNGEAGEAAEVVKKYVFHDHPFDREQFLNELGDVAWYLACCCSAVGANLSYVLDMNIRKLQQRYPEGFDPERSKSRLKDEA